MWEAQQTASSVVLQTQCPFWSIFMTMEDLLANTSDVIQATLVFITNKLYEIKYTEARLCTVTIQPWCILHRVYHWWYAGCITGNMQGISLVIYSVYPWWYAGYITGDIQCVSLVICRVYHWWYTGYVTGDIQGISLVICRAYHWWYSRYITGDIQYISLKIYRIYH